MNNMNKQDIDKILKNISKNTQFSEDDLKKAQGGNLDSVLSKLSPEQASRLNSIIKDEASISKFFSTPQAQNLLKKFLEGK